MRDLSSIKEIQKKILDAKEQRWQFSQDFIKKNNQLLCSFKFNIPSWPKKSEAILKSFEKAFKDFLLYLKDKNVEIIIIKETNTEIGPEIFFTTNQNPNFLKEIAIEFESNNLVGRLLDIDVIDRNGQQIERVSKRKCFLCENNAFYCMRLNKHSIEEIRLFFDNKLESYLNQ